MFYSLWKRKGRSKIWRVMCNLYQDQVTTIITKYGTTIEIEVENEIRQRKVLPGPEFEARVDELEVKLELKDLV